MSMEPFTKIVKFTAPGLGFGLLAGAKLVVYVP